MLLIDFQSRHRLLLPHSISNAHKTSIGQHIDNAHAHALTVKFYSTRLFVAFTRSHVAVTYLYAACYTHTNLCCMSVCNSNEIPSPTTTNAKIYPHAWSYLSAPHCPFVAAITTTNVTWNRQSAFPTTTKAQLHFNYNKNTDSRQALKQLLCFQRIFGLSWWAARSAGQVGRRYWVRVCACVCVCFCEWWPLEKHRSVGHQWNFAVVAFHTKIIANVCVCIHKRSCHSTIYSYTYMLGWVNKIRFIFRLAVWKISL